MLAVACPPRRSAPGFPDRCPAASATAAIAASAATPGQVRRIRQDRVRPTSEDARHVAHWHGGAHAIQLRQHEGQARCRDEHEGRRELARGHALKDDDQDDRRNPDRHRPGITHAPAVGGVRHPTASAVPRWACDDPQEKSVMGEIITVGLDPPKRYCMCTEPTAAVGRSRAGTFERRVWCSLSDCLPELSTWKLARAPVRRMEDRDARAQCSARPSCPNARVCETAQERRRRRGGAS